MKKRSTNSKGAMPPIRKWSMKRRAAARKVLAEARALIRKRGELAKGEFAWTEEGRECSPTSQHATTWCAIGAICHVTRSVIYGNPLRKMKPEASDAVFALGKVHERLTKDLGEAVSAVYDLNDGNDDCNHRLFADMAPAEHFTYVLKAFEKAERALR
jgi:hypothetical protein